MNSKQVMRYAVLALAALGAYNIVTGKTFWTIPLQTKATMNATTAGGGVALAAEKVPVYTTMQATLARPSASLPVSATEFRK